MAMRSFASLLAVLLLGACLVQPARQVEVARFDFGAAPAGPGASVGVSGVDVLSPSWLSGAAMQYRLRYAEPARRYDYADSRWVAPPAELLRQALEHRLAGAGRCRLQIEIDEFVQVFEAPTQSRVVLAGRATLQSGPAVLAHRKLALAEPAATADARGGVAATAILVGRLGDEMASWLAEPNNCR
jgi:cholesterol transport system auxiliary component